MKIVYKNKGEMTYPKNYRGIALICNPAKILKI